MTSPTQTAGTRLSQPSLTPASVEGAGAGSTPGQSSPRAAGPAPDHAFRSLNGGLRCVAIVGPLNSGQACGLATEAHPDRGGAGGSFTLPPTPRPPSFFADEMRHGLQLSLDRRSR